MSAKLKVILMASMLIMIGANSQMAIARTVEWRDLTLDQFLFTLIAGGANFEEILEDICERKHLNEFDRRRFDEELLSRIRGAESEIRADELIVHFRKIPMVLSQYDFDENQFISSISPSVTFKQLTEQPGCQNDIVLKLIIPEKYDPYSSSLKLNFVGENLSLYLSKFMPETSNTKWGSGEDRNSFFLKEQNVDQAEKLYNAFEQNILFAEGECRLDSSIYYVDGMGKRLPSAFGYCVVTQLHLAGYGSLQFDNFAAQPLSTEPLKTYSLVIGSEPVRVDIPAQRCVTLAPFSKLNVTFSGSSTNSEYMIATSKGGKPINVTVREYAISHAKCS